MDDRDEVIALFTPVMFIRIYCTLVYSEVSEGWYSNVTSKDLCSVGIGVGWYSCASFEYLAVLLKRTLIMMEVWKGDIPGLLSGILWCWKWVCWRAILVTLEVGKEYQGYYQIPCDVESGEGWSITHKSLLMLEVGKVEALLIRAF